MPPFSPDRRSLRQKPVEGLVLRLALPGLAAMLAPALCTLQEGLLLSRGDPAASSAAALCYPLLSAQQAVGFTLSMGAGSHVSRALGAGETASARQAASAALALAALLGLALGAAGLIMLTPLLTALGADAAALPHARPYAAALLLVSPLSCAGLVLSGLLRAQGKTAENMLACVTASACGAALSARLIAGMGLGTLGAGVSLAAREALTFALLAAAVLRAKNGIHPRLRDAAPRAWLFPAIMRSGLPTLLRQGAASLSGAMISRTAASFGPYALAGMGLASRAAALVSAAAIGFGQGFSPVCGVNFGAGKPERSNAAYRFSLRILTGAMVALGALVFFLSDRLLSLFGAQAETAAFAGRVLRAQSAVFFAQGAVTLMIMLTQAAGATLRASLIAVSRQGLFLIPALWFLPRLLGETGLVLSQSVSDVLALALSAPAARGLLTGVDRKRTRD